MLLYHSLYHALYQFNMYLLSLYRYLVPQFGATILSSDDGLLLSKFQAASRIHSSSERNRYLTVPFDNKRKRNLLYRSVMLWINRGHPMGKRNRMPVPACVVNQIRTNFPSDNYTGYAEYESVSENEDEFNV